MTSRSFLDLPGEIRTKIYHQVLCYDGITPEVRSLWDPWHCGPVDGRPQELCRLDPCAGRVTKPSGLHVQLDVMAPVRNGIAPGTQLPVLASDILTLPRTCRQVYEEAHPIFWAENAFIFPDQDALHAFTQCFNAKCLNFIGRLGIEATDDTERLDRRGRQRRNTSALAGTS